MSSTAAVTQRHIRVEDDVEHVQCDRYTVVFLHEKVFFLGKSFIVMLFLLTL